jgi:2-oxoglutarate/2-oxoacid ferredoxin oxidoreductase subunit beta
MQSSEHGTFLVPDCVMPFCKGCGHSHVLRKLNDALVELNLNPSDICLVTDIGCIGLADSLFDTPHSVHTTHGRSTAFATGIALADRVLADGRLKTIVLIGDGGSMIGLLHLVNAALMNVDLTVLVCNNFLFGMTGGQNSALSPLGFITPTTPTGNIIPPLDVCKIVTACHAGFVARQLATEKSLAHTIAEAIKRPGFSLVEIVELCTEHGTVKNPLTGNALEEIVITHKQQMGRIMDSTDRLDFGEMYREKFSPHETELVPERDDSTPALGALAISRNLGIVVAGSAGEKVQSAAAKFCSRAIHAGLYCTQKNDNPVTQGSGFSIAEIVLSPEEIHFTGIETPDAVLVVSEEGLRELTLQRVFDRLTSETVLILDMSLEPPPCKAKIIPLPLRKTGGKNAASEALESYAAMIGA